MLKRRRGFTLIELMIAVAIVGVFVAIVVTIAARGCSGTQANAEEGARAWAQSLGIEVKGVNCVTRDTDGDGYVSCTVAAKDGQMHAVECANGWGPNSGCRSPKARIPLGTRLY